MAQRFFFDLKRDRAVIADEAGILASDLNEAIVEALGGTERDAGQWRDGRV